MTKAMHIKTSGEYSLIEVEDATAYPTIKDIVGGYIDHITSTELGITGYVHDEGLLIGLQVNVLASSLFGRPLVGDCVVFGLADNEGNESDIPEVLAGRTFDALAQIILGEPAVAQNITQRVQALRESLGVW
jgi:hypothetical protein